MASTSAVAPALHDLQFAAFYAIYKTVLAIDATGPPAGEILLERFGLTDAAKGAALNVLDERVDLVQDALIGA